MKILVCDDADVMRRIHINILVEHGIKPENIIQASNGKEALEKIEGNEICLFLIDWNMPNLNGLELVQKIRNMAKYKTTPIVMVTAEGGKYNVLEAIEAGVTNYVLKPIKANILWTKIKQYLE